MACNVVTIEDDPQIAELLLVVLHSPGILLHSADNGDEGLALIRTVKPDLVVLDIMMPGRSGWEVYDSIRADPDLGHIPVIMLSVMPEDPLRRQAFARSDIDLYMTKPFDTLRLRRAVERMTGCTALWEPPEPGVVKAFSAVANRNSSLDFLPPKPSSGPLPLLDALTTLDSPDAVMAFVRQVAELAALEEAAHAPAAAAPASTPAERVPDAPADGPAADAPAPDKGDSVSPKTVDTDG